MPSINKIAVAIATTSALGGGGIGAYYAYNNSNNVSKQLISEGFKLISNEGDWTTILNKYKSATKNTFTGSKDDSLNEVELKKKCETILSQKPNNNNYKLARQWCVKEESIETILGNGGYQILNSTEVVESENNFWNEKVDLLKANPNQFEAVKDKIKVTETTKGDNVKFLKEACKNLEVKTTLTTGEKFNKNFDSTRKWCSIKKDSSNRKT